MRALSVLIPLIALGAWIPRASAKATIEPCSDLGTCPAIVGYTLYTDLKVSQVASLFGVDPIALLLANAYDISLPDIENGILPTHLFLSIPVKCGCVNGVRQATVTYQTLASDTLDFISAAVFGGLVSEDQIKLANSGISDSSGIPVGTKLSIPLPCTCFNNTDNNLPAVYMSYVVRQSVPTLAGIAARYLTTVTDLISINNMVSQVINDGDILAIPLSACSSNFSTYAEDHGLVVPNGSYAISSSHCVLCSCGPSSRNLYCEPAPLAVSCSSMQCRNSNLMLGNVTAQKSPGGCNVTSCDYSGFVNNTISTTLSTSLQPICPGPQQFPRLSALPTTVPGFYSPAPAPSEAGGPAPNPRTPTLPSPGVSIGLPPAGGPAGSTRGSSGSIRARFSCYRVLLLFLGSVVELVLLCVEI